MFEVERKVFFPCTQQGQQSLTAFGAQFLNHTILGFCTM
jgi:dipeptide/tripeptide permease